MNTLLQEELNRLLDNDKVVKKAKQRVEQTGIVFVDELDKIANAHVSAHGPDISREG